MSSQAFSTAEQPINVLFLCTHNSARSILAEALPNHLERGRFKVYSAGSSPRTQQQPNPLAIETLATGGVPTDGLRSKSWDEFAVAGAPHMDLVITVCDNAAEETCPFWPGQPATAHWRYADPSEGKGDNAHKREVFRQTLHAIRRPLDLMVTLPTASVERLTLQASARGLSNV